jgi:hypothetical protein
MEDERWLRSLLDVCRSEQERADTADFPLAAEYLEDLKVVIEQLETRLAGSVSAGSSAF